LRESSTERGEGELEKELNRERSSMERELEE
jgi:hypothetical protein